MNLSSVSAEELIGKRVLISDKKSYSDSLPVKEYKVLEVSPSKIFIKLQDQFGSKFWRQITEVFLVEILITKEKV